MALAGLHLTGYPPGYDIVPQSIKVGEHRSTYDSWLYYVFFLNHFDLLFNIIHPIQGPNPHKVDSYWMLLFYAR